MFRFASLSYLGLALLASPLAAADLAIATLVEGDVRVLRGTTWYRVVPGARVEPGDIMSAAERAQVQLEFATGGIANFVGAGSAYLVPPPAKRAANAPAATLVVPEGWLKIAATPPGLEIRTPSAQIELADGVIVLRHDATKLEAFIESGTPRFGELAASGAGEAVREAKAEQFWSKAAFGNFVPSTRPPKAFVDAMPRHYFDALASMAARYKSRPALSPLGEVSYAEAQPWLASRDRAAFERRFAGRLRDPAFRRAVEPDVARYPSWDRRLHPEKYAPRQAPAAR
jgi:hypothetical protein